MFVVHTACGALALIYEAKKNWCEFFKKCLFSNRVVIACPKLLWITLLPESIKIVLLDKT